MSRSQRSPMPWPAYPDIPIYLDTTDERGTAKTYGTTPTTPTTPDIIPQKRPKHLSPADANLPQLGPVSPVDPSPTTTIETSSHRSSIWPIPEPPPEVQSHEQPRRPALRFFPTQRPRVRLDSGPTLQIPIPDEKSPIYSIHPGLGIVNGPQKPPSIEISAPMGDDDVEQTPNLAERIEKRLYQYSISGNVVKRWLLEIISWVFSAICMAAVIGVLIYFKDDPLSKWSSSNWALAEKTGLTLNAYISVLSKMAGAALILPVSEALGQLKWSWFQQNSKQMWDFEIFDNASRGPWGSFLLLIRTKGKALAALGAMITLCSMLLDPFFQQVVSFPERWALQDLPSQAPRTIRYNPIADDQYLAGSLYLSYDNDLKQVTDKFAYGNGTQPVPFGNGTRPDIPLSCPTSKCSWPPYETLGVCSQCEDISSLLTYACLNTTIDWTSDLDGTFNLKKPYPNGTACGYYLNSTSENPILMSGYLFDPLQSIKGEALLTRTLPLTDLGSKQPFYGNGSIHFKYLRNTITDFLIVSAEGGSVESVYNNQRPIARECVLSWCVKTIKSSYDWGKYEEEVIATYMNTSSGSFPWASTPVTDETGAGFDISYTQDININNGTTPDGHEISGFGTSNVTVMKIQTGFADIFPSYTTVANNSAPQIFRHKTFLSGPPYTKFLSYNPWIRSDVSRHMERLATAMTNVIRSAPSNEMLPGNSFSSETWVSVRWEWLTLPVGLLLLSFVFLSATIFKSSLEKEQLGVLKNSAILTLLYGISDDMRNKLTRSSSRGTPRAKAKELKVKLNPNMGWRISGNLFSPIMPRRPQPPPGWI